jgi:hypothetical protein
MSEKANLPLRGQTSYDVCRSESIRSAVFRRSNSLAHSSLPFRRRRQLGHGRFA